MGIYKKGILGAFSGKVGNIVGSTWKGMQIIRITLRSAENGESSLPAQKEQRQDSSC